MLPFILVTTLALALVLYTEHQALTMTESRPAGRPAIIGGIAKTIASLAFIAAAISQDVQATLYGQTLIIALFWSFVGDVLLTFKGSRTAFIFGIVAFLMGHLGYVMLFRIRGIDLSTVLIGLAVFGLAGAFIWRFLANYIDPRQRGMRVAVAAYIAVITLMIATAVSTTLKLTPPLTLTAALPFVAAFLFWVSDLTVARQRFVKPSFWNRAIGLPLYYTAQYLFIALVLADVPS